ncbi:MAG: ion channel [Cyanobacteria bacterium P01_G01_bin.19]
MSSPFNSGRKSLSVRNNRTNKFKINFRNGRFEIPSADVWYNYWKEPYYLLLTVPWWGFLSLTVLSYILVNIFFAWGFILGGDCIANAQPGAFDDAFFFSVHTLTSIGYGSMYPTTNYADILVTIEALVGIVGIALITGLAFTRFSQPTAKVIFSRIATISEHNGVPTLMLRAANQRHNQIIEAQVNLYLMRDEVSLEGEYMRRFYLLDLLRDRTPRFTLSWTIMHPINESSPLWQATPESLAKTRAMLVVAFSGIDETVSQSLHAPYSYSAEDILWSHRFADIIQQTPQGHQYIDYTHFHQATPIER